MELKLHVGNLYWPQTATEPRIFDEVLPTEVPDVLIVGAGISGAISAYRLSKAGYRVVLIDQNQVGSGSTSANTGLIQYMSDMGLEEYSDKIGEEAALAFYRMSRGAIDTLIDMHDDILGVESSDIFRKGESLLLATEMKAVRKLRKELAKERAEGYEVRGVNEKELKAQGLNAFWGLESRPDITLNPYRFVLGLLHEARRKYGLLVFEQTKFLGQSSVDAGNLLVDLEQYGRRLTMMVPKILYATGYIPPSHIEEQMKNIQLYKSYVVVSQKYPEHVELPEQLLWEKKNPYTYIRRTFEPRLMIGGLDNRGKRLVDRDAEKRREDLISSAHRILPQVDATTVPVYSYCAIFGESKDDLPYIGQVVGSDREYVICGLGGNGTVYSTIASDYVLNWMKGEAPPYEGLFELGR